VPTILIGDQMWWGNDRLDFLEEYLAQPDLKFAIQEKVL
jgi:2-hydroxychromene-2-carboxylate isomerase